MAFIGSLAIGVTANVEKALKGFRSTTSGVLSLSKAVTHASIRMASFSGLLSGAGFGVIIKQSYDTVDALAKVSQKLGIATEDLIGLRHAAELTGVGTNTLDMGLQRMTRRIAEASQGTGEAKGALRELGLDAQRLASMTPDKQFKAIADAMGEVASQNDKIRLAFKLFDSEGVDLVRTLSGGSEALNKMQAEAERLGITFSNIDAAQVEMANDSFSKLRRSIQGVFDRIAVGLAPAIDAIATKITNWTADSTAGIDLVNTTFVALSTAIGVGADLIRVLEIGWKSFKIVGSFAVLGVVGSLNLLLDGIELLLDKTGILEAGWNDFLGNMQQALVDGLEKDVEDLQELIAAPMPSSGIQESLFNIQNESRKAAEEAAKLAKQAREVGLSIERVAPPTDKLVSVFDQLQRKLDSLTLSETQQMFQDILDAGGSFEDLEKASVLISQINDANLDKLAESMLESLKKPMELLDDFKKELDALGNRLTDSQRTALIDKRRKELFGDNAAGGAPASLQQGSVAARSAELSAARALRNEADKSVEQKQLKIAERSNQKLFDVERVLRDIRDGGSLVLVDS